MKNTLVYLRPAPMACVRLTGPYERTIPEAWDKLFSWIAKHGLSSPVGRGYGLAHDNPVNVAPEKLRYDACIQLTPMVEGRALRELSMVTLPGGPYMRQRLSGSYDMVGGLISNSFNGAGMASDLRLDERRPLVTIYLDDPGVAHDHDLRADLCMPISAASNRVRAA